MTSTPASQPATKTRPLGSTPWERGHPGRFVPTSKSIVPSTPDARLSRLGGRPDMSRLLLIDNYDSFTYNLYQYLCELGADVTVVRNDALTLDDIETMQPD